jgi:two-component system cell cycle sensor histidine kinase/response regulator CckA
MSERLRLLQVEDSISDAELLVRIIRQAGYDVYSDRVDDPEALRRALAREAWDIIIADHQMAQFDAPTALFISRENGRDIPFIIFSGGIGEELAVQLMKAGAHDFVNKNRPARLIPAIVREIREARARADARRGADELRESQERLQLAIEATRLGTYDYNPKTGRLIWSAVTYQQFGIAPGTELTFADFIAAVHPDDRHRVENDVADAVRPGTGGNYWLECRAVRPNDGVTRWISSWGRVFFDEHAQPVRMVGICRDFTERRDLEEQFRQAQKLESVGRLAGAIAHDFNNLLTVINGHSEIILDQLQELDPISHSITEIRNAGARAAELTRQLLAFSRKEVIDPKPVDLNKLISGTRNMIARLIGEDIRLVIRATPGLALVFADAGQLHQVIMNLVVNARDAMPDGGTLVLETAMTEDHVHLIVSDTGIGMNEETRKRIFEPFFTTKKEGEGTGLGLATVYGIIQQCGGTIDLVTASGEGTRFIIALPKTSVGPSEPDSALPPLLSGVETILIVEDQEEVRRLVFNVLESYGYRLLEAHAPARLSRSPRTTRPSSICFSRTS